MNAFRRKCTAPGDSVKLPCVALILCVASRESASDPPLNAELAGMDFLVGRWDNAAGKVADSAGSSKGSSIVISAAGGAEIAKSSTRR
jgi:hypothetical protein